MRGKVVERLKISYQPSAISHQLELRLLRLEILCFRYPLPANL
jgi:hypothetical protein